MANVGPGAREHSSRDLGGARDVKRLEPQVCFMFLYILFIYANDILGFYHSTTTQKANAGPQLAHDSQCWPTMVNVGPEARECSSRGLGGLETFHVLSPRYVFFKIYITLH